MSTILALLGVLVPAPRPPIAPDPETWGVGALVFLEAGGVTLAPCSQGHSGLNCTALVPSTTTFPAWGTAQERTALAQELERYYADMELVVVQERPPPWMPHLMAVVGGTSSLIGQRDPSCGLSWLSCGGLNRHLVSLTFATSCGGSESPADAASVVAQEVAHNFGLEHTVITTDLMFPTVTATEQRFLDECIELLIDDANPEPLCPENHALDCPDGAGLLQNSRQELLRMLGPRRADDVAPTIVELVPADGAVFRPGETIEVWATLSDPGDVLGVHWAWTAGPAVGEMAPPLTRCTNDVCALGFDPWAPAEGPWPFVALEDVPVGDYAFALAVRDLRGHTIERTIRVSVRSEGDGDTDDSDGDGTGAGHSGGGDACSCGAGAVPGLAWSIPWLGRPRRRRGSIPGRGPGRRPA